jgi:hypothetical protein
MRPDEGTGLAATGTRERTFPARPRPESTAMSRYVAPLGFTLAAAWVVVLFVLVNHP